MSSVNSSRSSTKSHNSTDIWLDRVATMSQEEKEEKEEDVQDYDVHDDMEGGGGEEGEQNDVDDSNDVDVEARNNHKKMISTDDARKTSMSSMVDDNNNNNNNASFGSLYRVAANVCQEMKEEEEKKKDDNYQNHNYHKIKHNRTTLTATSSIDAMEEEEEEEENDVDDIDDVDVEARRNNYNHTKKKNLNSRKSVIYDYKKNSNVALVSSSEYEYNDDDDDVFLDACTDIQVGTCTQGEEYCVDLNSNSCDSDLEYNMELEHQRVVERKVNGEKSRFKWNGPREGDDVQFRQSMIDLQMKSFKAKSTFDMPEDVYAFIIISKITSPSFIFACYVIAIKYIVYAALMSGIHVKEFEGADKITTAVKFFLIPVAIAMQDDLMAVYSGISNVKYDKSALEISPYATFWKFNLSYLLRFVDGVLSLSVNFCVMLETDETLGVFLNFAALHFLQDIDNVFYVLVEKGFFGDSMEHMSTVCKQIQWPRRRGSNKGSVILTELDTIFFFSTLVVCFILFFYVEIEVKVLDNDVFGGNTSYTNSSATTEAYISMVEWWNVCCKPNRDSN